MPNSASRDLIINFSRLTTWKLQYSVSSSTTSSYVADIIAI